MSPNEQPQQPSAPASPQPVTPVVQAQTPVVVQPIDTAQPQPTPPQTAEMFGEQHRVAAFMNPASSATPPSPRSHRKIIIAVGIFVLIVGVAATALLLTRGTSSKPEPSPDSPPVVLEDQKTESNNFSLATDIALASAPTFVVPEFPGWSEDTANAALNGIMHSGGCKATFTQLRDPTNPDLSDSDATDKVFANLISDLENSAKVSDTQYGTAQLAATGKDKTVEFKTVSFKYSTGLTESRSIVTARSIDGYVMGVRFFCQTPAFSDALNQEIIDKLTITLPEKS